MKDKKVLVIGNKPYHNFDFTDIHDSFDEVYRFNFAWPGKNNGTKFGKLAQCDHVYQSVTQNKMSKEKLVGRYKKDLTSDYIEDWHDFFQENKESFDKIYHQGEGRCNKVLETYECPHKFSKQASTGFSVIFGHLEREDADVFVSAFTIGKDEVRQTIGEDEAYALKKNKGFGSHSYSDERKILAWLHQNKKIDATLCMLDDTKELSINTDGGTLEPSKYILDLLKEN